MKKTKIALIASLLTLASNSVIAEKITLSKNMVFFDKNESKREVIEVINLMPGHKAFFETVINEVLEPQKGTKSQMKVLTDPSEAGLFVSPNKAIISEDENKTNISIINVNKKLDKERVYRIDVKPVISGIKGIEKGARIKVLMAYDILVHVQPNNPVMDYQYNFSKDHFVLKNTGNVFFTAKDGKQCIAKDSCFPMPTGKVYSDGTVKIPLEKDVKFVQYKLNIRGGEAEDVIFEK